MRSRKEIALLTIVTILLINGSLYYWQSIRMVAFSMSGEGGFRASSNNTTILTPVVTVAPSMPTPTISTASRRNPGITASSTSTTASRGASTTPSHSPPVAGNTTVGRDAPCDVWKTGRSKEDGRWYNFTSSRLILYAYTAFVDDRPSLESEAVVRIVAVADVLEDMKSRPTIHCRFHYALDPTTGRLAEPGSTAPPVEMREKGGLSFTVDVKLEMNPIRKIGMGWWLNKKIAREYVLTCPLPVAKLLAEKGASVDSKTIPDTVPLPASVSIVSDKGDVTSCLPVERPAKPSAKKDFVLCVQVAFGNIDPLRLIEWLELQILLGVKSIGLYDMGVHKKARLVMEHYAHEGLVELRKSDYIPDGPEQHLLHGSPVINDCMFRNLHAAEQLLVYDIDETILPRIDNLTSLKSTPFGELLKNLKKLYGNDSSQYMFRNSYFFLDIQPDISEPEELVFLRYKKTAPLSNAGYSVKSMVDMRSCIQMHNHYCWGLTKKYENRNLIDADPLLAKNQHYKKCHLSAEECKTNIQNAKVDQSILPYRDELLKRVKLRVEEIRSKMKGYSGFLDGYFKRS